MKKKYGIGKGRRSRSKKTKKKTAAAAKLSVNVWTLMVTDATLSVKVLIETVAVQCFNV